MFYVLYSFVTYLLTLTLTNVTVSYHYCLFFFQYVSKYLFWIHGDGQLNLIYSAAFKKSSRKMKTVFPIYL
jgi:hypothetical protein